MTPHKAVTDWTGKSGNGDWFDAANWSDGVPDSMTSVVFKQGAVQSVSLDGETAYAHRLVVRHGAVTLNNGRLDLPGGQAKSDLLVDGQGSLVIGAQCTVAGGGTVTLGHATLQGPYTPGTLTVQGDLSAGAVNDVVGQIDVAAGGTLNAAGGIVVVADIGVLPLSSSLSIEGTVDTTIIGGYGQFSESGNAAHVTASGGLSIQGTYAMTAGAVANAGTVFLGSAEVGIEGLLSLDGAGTQLTTGTITSASDGNGGVSLSGGAVLTASLIDMQANDSGAVLTVTGSGTALDAGTLVTGGVGLTNTLSVLDGGALTVGAGGLTLDFTALTLDGSAVVTAPDITCLAGTLSAIANGGDAVISPNVVLGVEPIIGRGQSVFEAGSGATLTVQGQVTAESGTSLVTEGDVVLQNGGNAMVSAAIMSGTLEIAATGADGGGTMSFLTSAAATLQVDAGVSLHDVIAGFGGSNAIDLAGFGFDKKLAEHYSGGTLTLKNGTESVSLVFTGSYTQDQFALTSDNHGGTLITFKM